MADRPARQPAGTPEPQDCALPGMGRRRGAKQSRRFDHAHLENHDHARAAGHDPAAGSHGTTTATHAARALPRAGSRGAGPGAPSGTGAQLPVVNRRHHGHIGRALSSRIQRYPHSPSGTSASPGGGGWYRWSASRSNGPGAGLPSECHRCLSALDLRVGLGGLHVVSGERDACRPRRSSRMNDRNTVRRTHADAPLHRVPSARACVMPPERPRHRLRNAAGRLGQSG